MCCVGICTYMNVLCGNMYVYECVVWEYVYICKYSAAVCMYVHIIL